MNTLALLLAAALPASAQAPRIGAAGAVSGGVTASGPTKRALKSGSEVFHKDEVSTDARGRLQVLLLDETVFTVGPESRVVLDEFVYDPFSGAGKVTAQVTKGVFRFVTGKVAGNRAQDMKIKIPSGTIGIRGTFGAGSVDENGDALVALLGPGPDNNGNERVGGIDIETGKDTQSLDEPGTGVIVKADGEVSDPFILTPEQTEQLNAGGGAGGSGGGSPGSAAGSPDDGDEGGEESGTEGAGQDTALAGADADDSSDLGDGTAGLGEETNTASQEASESGGLQDGLATWDDVRTVPSGAAHYQANGAWELTQCNGGSCANNQNGSLTFQMNIDFGARTVGGGGSYISVSDDDSVTGPVSASITINQTSFASEAGNATLNFVSGSAMDATVELLNANGNAAHSARATANYHVGNTLGSGTVNAPKFDGLIPQ